MRCQPTHHNSAGQWLIRFQHGRGGEEAILDGDSVGAAQGEAKDIVQARLEKRRSELSSRTDGGTYVMHGRSSKTIDPRIPTMTGWRGQSTWGFHRPGKHCLHQARSAVSYSASRMKSELHPAKNHL